MNECQRAEELNAYHDGELPPAAGAEFEEHLRQCPRCAAELAHLRELSRLLGTLAEPKLSPQVLHRLHRGAVHASQAGIQRMAQVVSAVAASVLLVCSIWMWRLPADTGRPEEIPQWERWALRQEEPRVAETGGEELALWMIEGLTGNGDHD
ncbi:MAG: hypothetical protein AMJ81_05615 [Phycisphaerae bacterium SM23_33]|nr:MAG: hypothetical protein AMJ81_05615 [Phycisphaerae bacterium SM23_33]